MVDSKKKISHQPSSHSEPKRKIPNIDLSSPQTINQDDFSKLLDTLFERFPQDRIFTPPKPNDIINYLGTSYTMGQKLGSGSFGDVFACRDTWDNELVAKVIKPKSGIYETDGAYEAIKHFWKNERWLLDLFRHPNITHILDAFECNHTFYLVMERCDYTIAEVLKQFDGPVTLPIITYAARDVLHALHSLHKVNFVHKDIHPGNVFLSLGYDRINKKAHFSCFKVGDLGIGNFAHLISPEGTRLAEWMLPPECLCPGEFAPRGSDPKLIDIYHTGLLLLFLAYGREIEFTHEEVMSGVPRMFAERLPSPLNLPLARALRRHTKDRTPSVVEFWEDIQKATVDSEFLDNHF